MRNLDNRKKLMALALQAISKIIDKTAFSVNECKTWVVVKDIEHMKKVIKLLEE